MIAVFTKELFVSASDFRAWKNNLNAGQESRAMVYEVASLPEPAHYPAVLSYCWVTVGGAGGQQMKIFHTWTTYADFKSQPVVLERVQQRDGSWVERKMPRRPVQPVPVAAVRDIDLDG